MLHMNSPQAATTAEGWRLRNSKSTCVECRISCTASNLYALTVVSGSETFLEEIYPDVTTAMMRATQVRDRLMSSGTWTVVGQQSVRQPDRPQQRT